MMRHVDIHGFPLRYMSLAFEIMCRAVVCFAWRQGCIFNRASPHETPGSWVHWFLSVIGGGGGGLYHLLAGGLSNGRSWSPLAVGLSVYIGVLALLADGLDLRVVRLAMWTGLTLAQAPVRPVRTAVLLLIVLLLGMRL